MVWQRMKLVDPKDRIHWQLGRKATWRDYMEWFPKLSKSDAKKMVREYDSQVMYNNDLYNCQIVSVKYNEGVGATITELSITRRDRKPLHDWRHLQYIKNDILGTDVEAIELYPDEDRLLDTANTYWLYAFPKGYQLPFGSFERKVATTAEASVTGAVQREFEPYSTE